MNTYIVALNEGVDYDAFWNEIENISLTDGFVPSRRVDIVNSRDAFKRICEYALTEEEAEQLKNDPRIAAVERPVRDLPYVKIVHNAIIDKNFDKTTLSTGDNVNWGLIRHSNVNNVYGNGTDDANNNYTYDLDGTGVDIVINDSGLQVDHPEFNNRVLTDNWDLYTPGRTTGLNYISRRDTDGHGTHVAGIAAGKTYGWAKGASIIPLYWAIEDVDGNGEPLDIFEALINWHNTKTNSRPTVVNMSWELRLNWEDYQSILGDYRNYIIGGQHSSGPILSGQNTSYYRSKGLVDLQQGLPIQPNPDLPYSSIVYNNALGEVIDSGIIVVQAAGNNSFKMDKPTNSGGSGDYDNYVNISLPVLGTFNNIFYHRGSSPKDPRAIIVGSLGATGQYGTLANTGGDRQAEYSTKGPRVDIYAAGTYIMSSTSSNTGAPYQHGNSSYKQTLQTGTSMAAPQVAGIIALRLQQQPLANIKASTNCETLKSWLIDNSLKNQIFSPTASTVDYTNRVALLGAPNRIAYINPVFTTYSYIKDDTDTWRQAKAVYVKDSDGTWRQAKAGWKKNDTGTWEKIYES